MSNYSLGKYDDAIKAYDKAIEINPNDADVWYSKGLAVYDSGDYIKAIDCYNNALEIAPEDHRVLNDKARALARSINDEALLVVEKALKINSNDSDILDTKGFILYNLSRYEESVECFNKAISVSPNDRNFSNIRNLSWQN